MMRTSGRSVRETLTVSSVDPPSTTMTSSPRGSLAKTCGRFSASLSVGITTEMRGWGEWLDRGAGQLLERARTYRSSGIALLLDCPVAPAAPPRRTPCHYFGNRHVLGLRHDDAPSKFGTSPSPKGLGPEWHHRTSSG